VELGNRPHTWAARATNLCGRALLGLALLALAACGAADASPTPATAASRPPATPMPPVAFPRMAPVAGERARMAALLKDTLVLVDGCLRVTSDTGTDYLLLWPQDVALKTDGGDIRVVGPAGQVLWRVGGRVAFGGGEMPRDWTPLSTPVRVRLREAPPARCPGPYWIAEMMTADRATSTPR